jgi:hypothetical protein
MSSQPYLRAADDGTYELLVPSRGSVHILPYCFHTDEDAANWLASRKGREQIQQIHAKYEKAGARQQPLCASNEPASIRRCEQAVFGKEDMHQTASCNASWMSRANAC